MRYDHMRFYYIWYEYIRSYLNQIWIYQIVFKSDMNISDRIKSDMNISDRI